MITAKPPPGASYVSIRLKLLAYFTLAMSLVFVGTYRWFFRFSTQQTQQQAQENINRILDAALMGINGDDLEGLYQEAQPRADGHTNDIRYWTHVSWLSLVESANPDARLYTYRTSPSDPAVILYLGSGSAHPHANQDARFLGAYRVPRSFPKPDPLQRVISSQILVNESGVWLRGVAPIFNSQGEPVAMLAVQLRADSVLQQRRSILRTLVFAFIINYLLLLSLIYFLAQLVTKRINLLSSWTAQVARGDYNNFLQVAYPRGIFPDELDEVAIAFQNMQQAVQLREGQLKESEEQLEFQVQQRTEELQTSLSFEATIRRITDRIRASLDEEQILKNVVEELGRTLDVLCCNTGIYDLENRTSTIRYGYSKSNLPEQFQALQESRVDNVTLMDHRRIYQQLLGGYPIAFSSLDDSPRYAILACSILEPDSDLALGDIWLFKPVEAVYSTQEIELTQQVANYCLIAIRQARLYRQTQHRLMEMEELYHLKDEFLSTVSHELRTPITNMRMAAKMLQTCADASRRDQYFNILESEIKREADLINDLLDLQKLDANSLAFDFEPIDIQELLSSILEPFTGRALAHGLQIHTTLEKNVPPIACDVSAFKRIISELINNACKYTPSGERIEVSVSSVDSLRVAIQVVNYGTELPEGEHERVFEKFYRVPHGDRWKQGGTGLGLALVKGLVEKLGGNITVQSSANSVQFTVFFSQFISEEVDIAQFS